MSKRSSIISLALGAGAIFAAVTISKIVALKSLSFILKDVKVNWDSVSPIITLGIAIQNPTPKQITVKSISGVISVNEQNIAQVYQNQEIKILPLAQTLYSIPATISLLDVAQSVIDLISTGVSKTAVNFKGNVNLEGIIFPISVTYKIA